MKRVVIGMSGGVDSSVAIILLKKMGYEVVGVTFKFIDDFDVKDAEEVAKKLSIEHHVIDYRDKFKKNVIDKFINDYSCGLTPNPCINCNRVCKFKYLFESMEKFNCDYIATGHYAKIKDNRIYRSVDLNKDQSYFLYNLPKEYLSKIIFPLEGIDKDKVRQIATDNNLIVANKKDSYDVCFIKTSFNDFINNNIKSRPGEVIDVKTNKVIGKHRGLENYTIGQRKGLNIGGTKDKMFVVGKDVKNNKLYIAFGTNNDYLISTSCLVGNINYLSDKRIEKCTAKFRYRQKDIPVEVEWLDNEIIVKYPQGERAVTPGQSCVLYSGDECLGGGIIKEIRKDNKKLWYL